MDEILVNILAVVVVVAAVGGAIFYIIKAKKRGDKCIGCPYAKQCGGNCSSHGADNTNSK